MAKLYFHYSAMNAGKTTLLLQAAHNYIENNLNPLLLKPQIDNRDSVSTIKSRIGIEKPCILISESDNLFDLIDNQNKSKKIDCVLIDEAQFLSVAQVWELACVVDDLSIPVMTYGIRTDFQGKLFPGSGELMAISDVLREVRAVDENGKNASMILRLDENGEVVKTGPQIQIGGNESYKAVTRGKWRQMMDR
jgi:thymidine kinase